MVRVTVLDAWDAIALPWRGETTVAAIKREALDAARVVDDPTRFVVKFRGYEIADEHRTLADAAIPPDGALIVLRRRRRAVR